MYEAFFQFQSRPFPATPVVGNYFPAQSVESARQNLIRAVERAEGPGLIIGPAGVGKTLLLRVLADHFRNTLKTVFLSASRVTTRKSLLQSILYELDLPYRGQDEGELRLSLIDAVRRNDQIPRGILLLIDEAHTLPLRLLDETRLITNIAHEGHPRVRLVLAGSAALEERFTNPKLDSFNQRIAARCYLQAFTRDEAQEYLRAELSWAGGDPDSIFDAESFRAVFQATDGIPRLINQICDHALVMAHAAGARRIGAGRIQDAWADLQQLPPPWAAARPAPATATSSMIEFGELGDDSPRSAPSSVPASALSSDASSSAIEFAPPSPDVCVAQNDCPCDEPAVEPHELTAVFQFDTFVLGEMSLGAEIQWFNCHEAPAELEIPEPREVDPFQEEFAEEVVVIDRHTAQGLDGLRGRPRVSSPEGRELALLLTPTSSGSSSAAPPPVTMVVETAEATLPATRLARFTDQELANESAPELSSLPAFEFSTLQDLPEIDVHAELSDESPSTLTRHEEQVDLDFEEEAHCVPLPWTRGTLGDDRDIIVVEEDVRLEPIDAPSTDESERRTEYRELFAQLRRVSN